MAASVEDVCNQALRRIGNKTPIGSIYEGTQPARIALEIYGQTRDDLLKQQDWDFAERTAVAIQSSDAAPPGWAYALDWPADCLKLRYVMPPSVAAPDLDPRPTLFSDMNYASTSARIIVSSIYPAVLVYTGQVTDVTTWDAGFTEALVEALARRFAPAMGAPTEAVGQQEMMADRATGGLAGSQSSVPADIVRQPMQQPEGRR